MTTYPGSPRLVKGAIVSIGPPDPTPNVIAFQYNPSTLTRSLRARGDAGEGGRGDVPRRSGAPVETIQLEIALDATDALEKQDDHARRMGVHPQLAALELLLHEPSVQTIANLARLERGVLEIVPRAAPLTLFVYGPRRVLPVTVTEVGVTEEAHDVNLNPLRAKVSLGLRVLTTSDLPPEHPGYALFLAHHVGRETMARIGWVHDIAAATGATPGAAGA